MFVVEDGWVVGVQMVSGCIGAARGVILGVGGFENNVDLWCEHYGLLGVDWLLSAFGLNMGDAIVAVLVIGVDIELFDVVWWCFVLLFLNGWVAFTFGFIGGIFVNSAGERYANEFLLYHCMGLQLQLFIWWVFDVCFDSMLGII